MEVKHIYFEDIDSTQTYAKQIIRSYEISNPYIITANMQTNSYGKNNSKWYSITGNLLASYILPLTGEKDKSSNYHITASVALGVAEVLEEYGIKTYIKWYNDILIECKPSLSKNSFSYKRFIRYKKIAGILIEKINIDDKAFLIVGIGMNISQSPDIPHVTHIKNIYPDFLLDIKSISYQILEKMQDNFKDDYDNVYRRYSKRLAYINSIVKFYNEKTAISYEFLSIDSEYRPIVLIENQRKTLSYDYRIAY